MKRLEEIGHNACTVTDHGVAHNLYKFYKESIQRDMKPILGVEFYVASARQLQVKGDFLFAEEWLEDDTLLEFDRTHLVVLAKDFKGYQNLCRLVSLSNSEGFYTKPRIDFELLKQHKEGLIVINGHVGTDIARAYEYGELALEDGDEEKANKLFKKAEELNEWYKDVFGDDYYLEIQNHYLRIEDLVTNHVIKLAEETDVKLVMTNDSHYTWRTDADIHRAHMANGLSKSYEEFMGGDFEGFATCDEFYIKDNEEMLDVALPYGDVAVQALLNTHEIVEKCNVTIDFVSFAGFNDQGKPKWKTKDYLFPAFEIPMPFANGEEYLKYLARKGLDERIERGEVDLEQYTIQDYKDRLEYEMGVINDMGFPTYFLVLWDIMRFCVEQDIPVGKGRGSGAGSIVCYSLLITDVDSLKYGLLFERFLNPARISMPDYMVA